MALEICKSQNQVEDFCEKSIFSSLWVQCSIPIILWFLKIVMTTSLGTLEGKILEI